MSARALGRGGWLTLALSNLVLAGTGGLSLLLALRRVYAIAKTAPDRCSEGSVLVVFGMRLRGEAVAPDYARRLERALALYRMGHTQRILLVGGRTGRGDISEAHAGRAYLTARGLPDEALVLEDQSRHTLENLQRARSIISQGDSIRVALVSNRYHLARVQALAHGLSMGHELCGAEAHWQGSAPAILRLVGEAYYLHWYWIGRAWTRATFNRADLERIT